MTNAIIGTVDWSNDYKNVLSVSSTHRQDIINHMNLSYHHSPIHINDFSIIKIDSFNATLRIDGDYSAISKHNYIIFKNSEMSENVYAFINSITFENPQQTLYLHLTIDLWQQYGGSVRFKKSFIERQHIAKSADSWRRWQAPEPFNFDFEDDTVLTDLRNTSIFGLRFVVETISKPVLPSAQQDREFEYEGTGSGANFYGHYGYLLNSGAEKNMLRTIMEGYSPEDKVLDWINLKINDITDHRADVVGINVIPAFVASGALSSGDMISSNAFVTHTVDFSFSNTRLANGYTPKNKKLLGNLGRVIEIYNKNGISKKLSPIKFSSNASNIVLSMKPLGSNSIYCQVGNYNQNENHFTIPYNASIDMGYNSNVSATKALNMVKSISGLGSQAISGATGIARVSAGDISGLGQVASAGVGGFESLYNISLAKGDNTATVGNATDMTSVSTALVGLIIVENNPTTALCQIMDDYLERYGYAINEIETPSISSRSNWNYLKGDISFTVNATNDVKNQLKSIFANGFTVWHNYATMLDYSQNNN